MRGKEGPLESERDCSRHQRETGTHTQTYAQRQAETQRLKTQRDIEGETGIGVCVGQREREGETGNAD